MARSLLSRLLAATVFASIALGGCASSLGAGDETSSAAESQEAVTATAIPEVGGLVGIPDIGRRDFDELGCSSCHSLEPDAPAGTGPNLFRITERLSVPEIVSAIRTPSAEFAAGFEPETLFLLQDGESLRGVVVARSAEDFVVAKGDSQIRLSAADVAKAVTQKSDMPEQLVRDGDQQTLANLVAFLRSLR